MENEIKVGEYVRTRYGEIGKVSETYPRLKWRKKKASSDLDFNSIVKHSSNLIDIIEEGDYVNGEPVEKIETGLDWGREITTTTEYLINEEDIETVITKEMMKSIEYKVK